MVERLAESVRADLTDGAVVRAVKLTVLLETTSPPGRSMSPGDFEGKRSE